MAERLRDAAGEGRLTPEELDERLTAAYGAQTVADLDELTVDLPAPPVPAPPKEPAWRSEPVRRRFASFISANLICNVIWIATGADSSYWPRWVLLFTGVALIGSLVHAVMGVEERKREQSPPELDR